METNNWVSLKTEYRKTYECISEGSKYKVFAENEKEIMINTGTSNVWVPKTRFETVEEPNVL